MWVRTQAEDCASYLKKYGNTQNATRIVVNNFGGKFLGYVGSVPNHILQRYAFRDSFLYLRFHRDLQEDNRVEIFVDSKSVATI